MKRKQNKYGLTLVEVLVAIAIIAVLAAGLYSVGNYVETQSKEKLTKSTIEILCAALEQYRDSNDCFPFRAGISYGQSQLESTSDANGLNGVVRAYVNDVYGSSSGSHRDEYSSIEALYYFLNRVPDSKKIIGSISSSLLTDEGDNNKDEKFRIFINPTEYPLIRVIDPWKTAFRYTYRQGDNFPVITSAGPDKDFGDSDPGKREDNISSRQ